MRTRTGAGAAVAKGAGAVVTIGAGASGAATGADGGNTEAGRCVNSTAPTAKLPTVQAR